MYMLHMPKWQEFWFIWVGTVYYIHVHESDLAIVNTGSQQLSFTDISILTLRVTVFNQKKYHNLANPRYFQDKRALECADW